MLATPIVIPTMEELLEDVSKAKSWPTVDGSDTSLLNPVSVETITMPIVNTSTGKETLTFARAITVSQY